MENQTEKRILISDFDGTLGVGEIERDFINYLMKGKKLSIYNYFLAVVSIPVNRVLGVFSKGNLLKAWKAKLSKDRLTILIHDYIDNYCNIKINRTVYNFIETFNGYKVLLTGSSVELVCSFLHANNMDSLFDEVIGCTTKKNGFLINKHPYGKDKVAFLENMKGYKIGLENEYADRYFLCKCDEVFIVNPDDELERFAKEHGWNTIDFLED